MAIARQPRPPPTRQPRASTPRRSGDVVHDLEAVRARQHEGETAARLLVTAHRLASRSPRAGVRPARRPGARARDARRARGRPRRDRPARAHARRATANTRPIATASPWATCTRRSVSSAWANVCPKLSVARTPVSLVRVGSPTTAALISAHAATSSSSASGVAREHRPSLVDDGGGRRRARPGASARTSRPRRARRGTRRREASPAAWCPRARRAAGGTHRRGSCPRQVHGGLAADRGVDLREQRRRRPARRATPRWYTDAANPAVSPTTPPPTATTTSPRSRPPAANRRHNRADGRRATLRPRRPPSSRSTDRRGRSHP